MPEATKDQLEREVIHVIHQHNVKCGCIPLTNELMEIVEKAYIFGKDAAYHEAYNDIKNGMYN